MNEINRQFGYSSQQNRNNPYIDDVRFDTSRREPFTKQRQMSYIISRFASVSDMLDYVSPDSQLIRNIRDNVAKNPSKFGVNVNTFLKAYENLFVIMNNICLIYNQTGKMADKIFNKGFSVFNENLYNDLVDGKLNILKFVNATVVAGNSLAPLFTPINTKPNPTDERNI